MAGHGHQQSPEYRRLYTVGWAYSLNAVDYNWLVFQYNTRPPYLHEAGWPRLSFAIRPGYCRCIENEPVVVDRILTK